MEIRRPDSLIRGNQCFLGIVIINIILIYFSDSVNEAITKIPNIQNYNTLSILIILIVLIVFTNKAMNLARNIYLCIMSVFSLKYIVDYYHIIRYAPSCDLEIAIGIALPFVVLYPLSVYFYSKREVTVWLYTMNECRKIDNGEKDAEQLYKIIRVVEKKEPKVVLFNILDKANVKREDVKYLIDLFNMREKDIIYLCITNSLSLEQGISIFISCFIYVYMKDAVRVNKNIYTLFTNCIEYSHKNGEINDETYNIMRININENNFREENLISKVFYKRSDNTSRKDRMSDMYMKISR